MIFTRCNNQVVEFLSWSDTASKTSEQSVSNLFKLVFDFLKGSKCTEDSLMGRVDSFIFSWLISKVDFNFQIFQRNKFFSNFPVFSNWVNFIKKVSIIHCSWSSKIFKAIYFPLEISKVVIFRAASKAVEKWSISYVLKSQVRYSSSPTVLFITPARASVF